MRRPSYGPAPTLGGTGPLPIGITTPAPRPAGLFSPGTPEFRFWTAAECLTRGAGFWSSHSGPTRWFTSVGPKLRVVLDDGVDFNAFYDRQGLKFFHGNVPGFGTVFSAESPDVACHELGHAVLDSLRPALFNASFIETASFHEAFGDMSAMLSALQLPTMRARVLTETHGHLARSSSLSRLAEQLGFAIRRVSPGSVEVDCLRNAANAFFYRNPSTLPPSAPASQLSSEPHSFSRVFTGAFLDVLAGMLTAAAGGSPATAAQLQAVSETAARYLIGAIKAAPVVPAYYSQVAAAMVHAAAPADKPAVAGGFVHHGILSLPAASAAVGRKGAPTAAKAADDLGKIAVPCAEYGFPADAVLMHGASEAVGRQEATPAAFAAGALAPDSAETAAKDFLEDLLQQGRVEVPTQRAGVAGFAAAFSQPYKRKTHRLVKEAAGLRLERTSFDCGFDCGSCQT